MHQKNLDIANAIVKNLQAENEYAVIVLATFELF